MAGSAHYRSGHPDAGAAQRDDEPRPIEGYGSGEICEEPGPSDGFPVQPPSQGPTRQTGFDFRVQGESDLRPRLFLAPPPSVSKYKIAQVECRILESETGRQPAPGSREHTAAAKIRLERNGRVGMPTKEFGATSPATPRIPGVGLRSVELFTGAGGLALGIERAGFHHDIVVERDRDCCATLAENQNNGFAALQGWKVFSGDVRDFDYASVATNPDLLAGGPPCQPFSIGGKHKGPLDRRDMFPQMVRAVRELQPKAVLVENVRGLLRESFAKYFEYITLQLRYPELVSKSNEDWTDHLSRLERHHTKGSSKGLHYNVVFRPVNAANYGVPQKRHRVIIVGFRADLGVEWSFPDPTHSEDALLHDQWVSGTYWERHKAAKKDRPKLPARMAKRIGRLRQDRIDGLVAAQPWRTVRDALVGIPDPERSTSKLWLNHQFNQGARSYPGHTGSPLDEAAKTLKAGDHGVPGGENMMMKPDGSIRYFTVRESARLQTFPDDYSLHGAWTEAMRHMAAIFFHY